MSKYFKELWDRVDKAQKMFQAGTQPEHYDAGVYWHEELLAVREELLKTLVKMYADCNNSIRECDIRGMLNTWDEELAYHGGRASTVVRLAGEFGLTDELAEAAKDGGRSERWE